MIRRKVQVFLYRRAPALQVLLLRRTRPSREGQEEDWAPVTGNVETHENVRNAALRECMEEVACEVAPEPLGLTFTYEKKGKRFHETVFAAVVPADQEVELSDEHSAHAWLAPPEAAKRLHWPEQRKALDALVARYS